MIATTHDPLDQAFANDGGDHRFMQLHGGARECVCPVCKGIRYAPIETRSELIARVAAEMHVEVSTNRPVRTAATMTTAEFTSKWAAVRAAKRRQSVVRWR